MECGWVCWALVLFLLADTSRGQDPSCCGDILRPATVTQDQITGYSVPEGWTLCYLDRRDGEYAGTPCHALLQGIPGYGDSYGLLAAGGNFGCGLGFNQAIGAPPVEPAFTPGLTQRICRDDNREQGRPYFVGPPFMTFGVCIRGLTCGGLGDACSDDPCHDQATCAPEATCTCNYGYTGDGRVSGTGCSGADPVGLWPLNAQYGASDATGNGNDGVATGTSLVPGPFGNVKGAFLFSGKANSYIDIPNNGDLDVRSSYTILAHIYPTGGAGPIFNYVGNNNNDQWAVHLWQTGPRELFMRTVRRDGHLSPAIRATVLRQNAWNYVGGTYDSSTGVSAIWNNGELADQIQVGVPSVASQYPVRVARRDGDGRIFSGRIACLQLYNFAMTKDQIAAARDKCRAASTTSLAPTTAAKTTSLAPTTTVTTTLAPTSVVTTTAAQTTQKEIDECLAGTDNCSPDATCTDSPDSFTCTCNPGYSGDGVTCSDVDECASAGGGCAGTCTNSVGSFACSCGIGLVLNGDGLACDACSALYPGLDPSHNFGVYRNQCFWSGSRRTPRLNYMAAKQECQSHGGTLAMIKDDATQTFLRNHLTGTSGRTQRSYWIGLDDLNAEKVFLWNDGTPLGEYDRFRSGAPHKIRDCVTLWRTRRLARWDIKNCNFRYPYICQLGSNGSK